MQINPRHEATWKGKTVSKELEVIDVTHPCRNEGVELVARAGGAALHAAGSLIFEDFSKTPKMHHERNKAASNCFSVHRRGRIFLQLPFQPRN
jgi:hypothetical protein